jgi:hypothetical protein
VSLKKTEGSGTGSVVAYERSDTIYAEAADGLDMIEDVDDAVAWANDFIARTTR